MGYLDIYKKSDKSQNEKQSFDFLITDLLSNDTRGKDKQRSLSAHNIEDSLKFKFVPSMFYIVMYAKTDKPESIGKNNFYDVCPLIFCLGVGSKTITGLNFNFIPNNVRAAVLDLIVETNPKFYRDISNINLNELVLNNQLCSTLLSSKGVSSFLSYINAKIGIDLSPCVRTYNIKDIANARLIEYDEWGCILYLSFNDAVRGANLASIQRDVITGTDK